MDDPDQSDAAARFPFDAIYKALCCHRQTVGDMLTGFLAEAAGPLPQTLIDALDLDRVRKLSMEWVTREFRLRHGDQIWEAPFKPDARRRGYPPFLLVNLEFQSRRDGLMALRFVEQGNKLYRELRAQGVVAEGQPCPVLCVLLHNGRSPWTAASAAGNGGHRHPKHCWTTQTQRQELGPGDPFERVAASASRGRWGRQDRQGRAGHGTIRLRSAWSSRFATATGKES